MINNSTFKANGKNIKAEELLKHYLENYNDLYTTYLPLINKRLFVMEVTPKGTYVSPMLADILNIALLGIKISNLDPTDRRVENGTGTIISSTVKLFNKYVKEKLGGKPGLARRHIYGTRSHFTFRAVITSLRTYEDYDILHLPWVIGVTAFRPHILNKLIKKHNFTYREANKILHEVVMRYDPLIDDILNELIKESPYKGIPVIFNRNPSLLQSSSLCLYVTKFKTDIEDRSIGINTLVIKGPNGDL